MLVEIDVCWRDRPIASATDMKRLAKRVRRMGSGPFLVSDLGGAAMVVNDTIVVSLSVGSFEEVESRRDVDLC